LIIGTINTGSSPSAEVDINGGTTTITSYIGVGRGNGTNNAATNLTVNNSAIVTSGNFAIGYSNGVAGYTSSPTVTFNDTSSYTDTGVFTVGESVNASGGVSTVNVNGSASVAVTSVAAGAVNIGATGAAVLNQNGGSVTISGTTTLARDAASNSSYFLNGGVLTAPSIVKGLGTANLNFNGGILTAPAASATFLQGLTRANVRDNGAIINTGTFNVTVAQPLVHSNLGGDAAVDGGLTKQGSGTLTLTGLNSYTGDTTVSAGTLELQALGSLDDAAKVKLLTGSTLQLNFVGTDTVGSLYFDGVLQAAGIWGRVGSGAAHESPLITSDGLLLVSTGAVTSPFVNWAATTHGLTGADALAGADPDFDGYNNLAEFVLGGEPNPANPGANTDAIAPTVAASGSNHVFSFRRTQLAMTQPGISVAYEYGSALTGWTTAVDGVSGISIVVTANGYGAGIDRVDVSIPDALGVGSKLFARMNAVLP
jgi:autotransporter-associated beta strand protein